MLFYSHEMLVRIWTHGCGHAAGTIRSDDIAADERGGADVASTYISWWPGLDRNKHGTPVGYFHMRTAGPKGSYFKDKQAETGSTTLERYRADPTTFAPRANQRIRPQQDASGDDLVDNPEMPSVVTTRPSNKVNLPGLGATVEYKHQRHGTFQMEDTRDLAELQQQLRRGEKMPVNARALWGLDLRLATRWWTDFFSNPKNGYQYASTANNCAGVMMGALTAAGTTAFVPIKSAWLYRTPQEVRDVALALEKRLVKLNLETMVFQSNASRGGDTSLMARMAARPTELFTVAEFKHASRASAFGQRREQVAKMDAALETFHKAATWSDATFATRLGCLVTIMDNVLSHLHHKPASVRRAGVEQLGAQVVNLLARDTSSLNTYVDRHRLAHDCTVVNFLRDATFEADPEEGIKAKNR